MSSFVGAKGGAGTYQRIISWIPPHDVFVEPFAGTAAITRHKRPAARTVLIDRDPGAIDGIGGAARWPGVELIVGDGVEYLRRARFPEGARVVVYCDPPYLRETRRDGDRDYYAHDWSDADHAYFLDMLVGADPSWAILVSGYPSPRYDGRLAGWCKDTWQAMTRGGPAQECLWANFARPERLHDYRHIGTDFDDRWRIHKRQRSWCRMLSRMPALERRAMLAAIAERFAGDLDR